MGREGTATGMKGRHERPEESQRPWVLAGSGGKGTLLTLKLHVSTCTSSACDRLEY